MSIKHHKLKLTHTKSGKYYVSFYHSGKRFRMFDSNSLGLDIKPNKAPEHLRQSEAVKLFSAFEEALNSGWSPNEDVEKLSITERIERVEFQKDLSRKYLKALHTSRIRLCASLRKDCVEHLDSLTTPYLIDYLEKYCSTASVFHHERKRLHKILGLVLKAGEANPCSRIKKKKEKAELHKPFNDVAEVLEDIRKFSPNLHLCCLLTYGCLVRPHQEIRNLKWSDFGEDLSFISLSGKRNKSGRNRIVPVNEGIKCYLSRADRKSNIFTGTEEPYAESYFKVLWRRYKKHSNLIEDGQTLYSFRHSGAISVYLKTGSLTKLQSVMGHSDLKVTLTYLRGLELPSISLEDMPDI